MKWLRDLRAILHQEPEIWLAYLHGQQMESIPDLTRKRPRVRGLLPRLLLFFYFLLRNIRWRSVALSQATKVDYLVYASSINQLNSLDSTIDALHARKASVLAIAKPVHINTPERALRYRAHGFSVLDTLKTLVMLAVRVKQLRRDLKARHPLAIRWHFDNFCEAYCYLVFFHTLLRTVRPGFVITSNDHNTPNRCLLAVAHQMGISTVYLQHASVSALFPALRVNYAFLDGQSALESYRQCEANQPAWTRAVPVPAVFLTGQKKNLPQLTKAEKPYVGLAINTLDDPDKVVTLARLLIDAGHPICLRWHPRQAPRQVKLFRDTFNGVPQVRLSDPKTEPVAAFMDLLHCLIAGNSSIHLEAALLGIQPIYHEITAGEMSDYYGFVCHGLVKQAQTLDDLMAAVKNSGQSTGPDQNAVRYYSATYGTEWYGREGDLVAESLIQLAAGKAPDGLWGYVEEGVTAAATN